MEQYNEEEIITQVKIHIAKNYDNAKDLAEQWGVSSGYISQILNGAKRPPDWLLEEMGFEHVVDVYYTRIKR